MSLAPSQANGYMLHLIKPPLFVRVSYDFNWYDVDIINNDKLLINIFATTNFCARIYFTFNVEY